MAATSKDAKAVREILKPSPVKGSIPDWFRRGLLKAYPQLKNDKTRSGSELVSSAKNNHGFHWFDHCGQTEWKGQKAFVSEPYGLDLEDVQSVADVAKKLGCKYEILANSYHYPGQTIRVLIYQKK